MKQTALLLQRPDTESRYLRANVIQPAALGKYTLHRFIGKTIQLNVGQLYQPLRFNFEDFLGDFTVYFSQKAKQPGEENGYDQKNQNQKFVCYPKT